MRSILFILALLFASNAQAEKVALTNLEFLQDTNSGGDNQILYLGGYVDAIVDFQVSAGRACMPDDVTTARVIELAYIKIRKDPQRADYPASNDIAMLLAETWPCSKSDEKILPATTSSNK
jgi:hypothetical protein